MKIGLEGALAGLTPEERRRLLARAPDEDGSLPKRVREIMDRVRRNGDQALRDLARELDGVELDRLEVPRERWDQAVKELQPAVRRALEQARSNIESFHRAQLPEPLELEVEPGVHLGWLSAPLPAVGVYAPGGRASYPSSVLMGVVPAVTAGVQEVVVCSPPSPSGEPAAPVLAACAIAGATRVFALGGAGAVAALAYGTESVPATSAVVGPGNHWVTQAKREVAGYVRTDAPAGPSEVLVVAEEPGGGGPGPLERMATLLARELVAQAEHDPQAAALLVTPSPPLLRAVRDALETEVRLSPRRDTVVESLARNGALLQSADLTEALRFAQDYAPEHLALYTSSPRRDLSQVSSAGSVFLGSSTSVTFGDYLTGANHVLPTGGMGRSFSGLSSLDYVRFFTYQEVSEEGAARLAEPTAILAGAEDLPGHARAALARHPQRASEDQP